LREKGGNSSHDDTRAFSSVEHQVELVGKKKVIDMLSLCTISVNHLLFYLFDTCCISLSTSVAACPVALSRSDSSNLRLRALAASSAARDIKPHLIHNSTRSSTVTFVHFGINKDANFGLPAARISLMKGCKAKGKYVSKFTSN
jgi:hypothetical protein